MPTPMLAIIRTISPAKIEWFLSYNAYTRVAQGTAIISQSLGGDTGRAHWRQGIVGPTPDIPYSDERFCS